MAFIGQYTWPMIRISAFFMVVPIFGSQLVTPRVRLAIGLLVSLIVTQLVPQLPPIKSLTIEVMLLVVQQVVIGVTLGFVTQIVFQLFVLAGQMLAMKMGLGFAAMNDPINGVSTTVVSQFYLLLTTLLFVSVNGHLILVEVIVNSFTTLPVGGDGLGADTFWRIVLMGSFMFKSALSIALPVVTALLIVNMAFGVMTRAAPQMNVFAIGFPATLVIGVFLLWLSLGYFLPKYMDFIDQGLSMLFSMAKM